MMCLYYAKGFNPIYATIEELILTKYLRNSFLATKVAFFNEVFDLCESAGIDYNQVKALVGEDKRITHSHMQVPGPDGDRGFGGACFPKDTEALLVFSKCSWRRLTSIINGCRKQ